MRHFSVVDCDQRSPEWFLARAGRLTSSTADAMLSQPRKGSSDKESAGRRNLRTRLALERVMQRPLENDYSSQAMRDGADREALALSLYESRAGVMLDKTGFLAHTSLMAGASLDGHLDDFTGIVEVKSPIWATHWDYLRTSQVPTDYRRQALHQLWLTGAEWCDWVSFNPDFPEALQLRVVRIDRDAAEIADYETKVLAFLAEVERDADAIQTMSNIKARLHAAVGAV